MGLSASDIARALGAPAPTPEQQAVIEAPHDAPQLVVAGAGSGKTETMAARVVWLVANELVQPEEVLGLTFTRKAATELSRRIDQRLGAIRERGLWTPRDEDGAETLGSSATVSTYHAYAGRLVREHGLRLGVEPDTRLLTEAATWQYATEAVLAYDGDLSEMTKVARSVTAAVLQLAGEMSEHLVGSAAVRAEVERWLGVVAAIEAATGKPFGHTTSVGKVAANLREKLLVLPVVDRFRELKRTRDAMDFGDQMAVAARLAVEVAEVGAMERARFRAVLLDEFQDTSEAQMSFLRALFVDGANAPVTAVGDPNQSIYGWRGASATTLARFPEAFAAAGPGGRPVRASVRPLSTSWRNDRVILDAANLVAAPLREGMPIDVPGLAARPGSGPGRVVEARFGTRLEEADWVAARFADLRRERPRATGAVLCRKRSQFPAIMAAFEAAGVPFEVVGLGGLLTMPEVADIISLLEVVDDPTRGDHLMRLLTGPLVHLGAADIDGLWAWARHRQRLAEASRPDAPPGDTGDRDRDLAVGSADTVTLAEVLEDLPSPAWRSSSGEHVGPIALDRVHGLARVVRRMRGLTGLGLADLVGEAERALGLDIEVAARPEYAPAAARAHLDAFADVAAGFALSSERPSLRAFLDWLAAAMVEERGLDKGYVEPTSGAVQVLTVHSAKGLEWDVVAVPGLVEGNFPAHEARSSFKDGRWRLGAVNASGWTGGITKAGLPYPLRGDVDGLPVLHLTPAQSASEANRAVDAFRLAGGEHELAEERRLAYVAFTRARGELLLTTHLWGGGQSVRLPSRYLDGVAELPGVERGPWVDLPVDGRAEPPERTGEDAVQWPDDPMRARRHSLGDAPARVASLVEEGATGAQRAVVESRRDREIALLLAERERSMGQATPSVALPPHLSTSDVVSLAADPDRFALDLRRPVPAAPALEARRGTAFHAWVEEHYSRAAIVDLDDLPGSADADAAPEADVDRLRAAFLRTPWASLPPVEVETTVETVVEGIAVRGRIDAVFAGAAVAAAGVGAPFDADECDYVVVDWKTGPVPPPEEVGSRALQLATYALAYARLRGIDPGRVRGAFVHVAAAQTLWPELAGADGLMAVLGGRTVASAPA
jgi:DNA helicase-2/ATP-dependent DNA helicase PcrA